MKRKGFTLIELLAVIIILGILMLIAIPSVTTYINNSRKSTYVGTINELVKGASAKINSGSIEVTDTEATYYIPASAMELENGNVNSPYGALDDAYVVVTFDGEEYQYYFVGKDETNIGIKSIKSIESIESKDIDTNIGTIPLDVGVNGRTTIIVMDKKGEIFSTQTTNNIVDPETGKTGSILCKRATTLHTEICSPRFDRGCPYAGYTVDGSKGTTTIEYGTLVSGNIKPGDAFDCDVNNDGIYNSTNERFYYVTSNGNNAVLFYYSNISCRKQDWKYDSDEENWHGPRYGYNFLPSVEEWDHPMIKAPGKRQITNELGGTTTNGHTIEIFDYKDRAARFLTYQELNSGCNYLLDSNDFYYSHFMDQCIYFLEGTNFKDGDNEGGYYLETPFSNDTMIYLVSGTSRALSGNPPDAYGFFLFRPVIEVNKSFIK